MSDPISTTTAARALHRLQCGECGWSLAIHAVTDAPLRQCPWCGWPELDPQCARQEGAAQRLVCATHGDMLVAVLDANVSSDDFMDNLLCPFCPQP